MMEYEIHVTVKSSDVDQFIIDCNEIGIKPIVIETEKDNMFNNQVMTSSKHKNDDCFQVLKQIEDSLTWRSYDIIRKKIEIRPLPEKHSNHMYYESHFRLKLNKDFDYTELKKLCKKSNFHLSKNLFKKSPGYNYQMIIYRNYDISFVAFNHIIDKMKEKLLELNIFFDKIEVEECIFDSNIHVDSNWI